MITLTKVAAMESRTQQKVRSCLIGSANCPICGCSCPSCKCAVACCLECGCCNFDRKQIPDHENGFLIREAIIESIEQISILDALDVPARLEELSSLQDGWLDGKGIAPSPEGLDWLTNAFDTRYPEELPLPSVYPTAEGGIRAEWSVKRYEVSLEIDLSKKTGEWHQLNLDTDDEDTRSLNLETDEDWKWLAAHIGKVQEWAA